MFLKSLWYRIQPEASDAYSKSKALAEKHFDVTVAKEAAEILVMAQQVLKDYEEAAIFLGPMLFVKTGDKMTTVTLTLEQQKIFLGNDGVLDSPKKVLELLELDNVTNK